MAGKSITIEAADGGQFSGYLAVPESGSGPGIVVLQEIFGVNSAMRATADYFAEEGYTVLVPDLFWRIKPGIDLDYDEAGFKEAFGYFGQFDVDQGVADIGDAIKALRAQSACQGKVAALGYCLGGKLSFLTAARHDVDAAISYYGVAIHDHLDEKDNISCPMVFNFGGADEHVPMDGVEKVQAAFEGRDDIEIYVYPEVGHAFANPVRKGSYNRPAAMMAHSRTVAILHRELGPHYDLSALWEAHIALEFETRDAEATMKTMVDEPYVNHIPVMTGGVGRTDLYRFYKNHFIPKTPADTKLIPVSRTIGADRIVDELLFCFTHDIEIDWMLPGVEPTGKYVEIPLVAVVNFRGGKLYHEHIYWDQASVLVQLGLLDPKGLPIAGVETAKKLLDETLPSNTLMNRWAESAPKAAE